MNEVKKLLLTADIGGTRSRFAMFQYDLRAGVPDQTSLQMVRMICIDTGSATSFADLLYRAEKALTSAPNLEQTQGSDRLPGIPTDGRMRHCSHAMIAIPGTVHRDASGRQSCARMAHVAWNIALSDDLPIPRNAKLINDFAAQAWACLDPVHQQLQIIRAGKRLGSECEFPAPITLVGAGTGLGVAMLLPPGTGHPARVVPSEGGHMLFPFVGREEYQFADWFRARIGMPAPSDLVVTGGGLAALHEFHTGEVCTPAEVAAQFSETSHVFQWFSRFYGRFCRNVILMTLPDSGLRITGGIAAANPSLVTSSFFSEELLSYAPYAEYLSSLPVSLVGNTNAALWGAAFAALSR